MTTSESVGDPGLQNERTSLAWRRTALSLLVGVATMTKVTAPEWGAAAGAWMLAGLPGSVAILVWSTRTYHARRVDSLVEAPAVAVVLASATTVAVGGLALAMVLT